MSRNDSCRLLVAALVTMGGTSSALRGQPILYVDGDATGANDGSGWCDAYLHLQDALAEAASSGGSVTEIRVAGGTYRPDRSNANPAGSGDRNASFAMLNGVAMRGGYAGCAAPNPDFRDTAAQETVLDGDLAGDDVLLTSQAACTSAGGTWYDSLCSNTQNNGENSYQVVVSISNDSSAVLDGFAIRNGNADGPSLGATPASKDQGPAVNVYTGTPQIIDCRFENHRAINHGTINDHGGATITDCEFRRNFATRWAGGLHVEGGVTTTVSGTAFYENATAAAAGGGGGIFNKGGTLALTNCIISRNRSAKRGGGIYNNLGSSTTLTDCTIEQNQSAEEGAGIYSALATTLQATRVVFDLNAAAGGTFPHGGGAYNFTGTYSFDDCSFTRNSAQFGGGVYNLAADDVVIERTEFLDNAATIGGAAAYNDRSSASYTECAFRGNRSTNPGYGGAMYNIEGAPSILRCVFESNQATYGGAGVYNYSSSPSIVDSYFANNSVGQNGGALYFLNASTPTVTGCTFEANSTANIGGALFAYIDANVFVDRCRFLGNTAVNAGGAVHLNLVAGSVSNSLFVGNSSTNGFGGGMAAGGPTASSVTNCTFVRNTAGGFAAGLYANGTLTNSIFWENSDSSGMNDTDQVTGSSLAIKDCDVQGWTGVLGGTGNFSANPLFVNMLGPDGIAGTGDDNLRLQPGSPCLNVGDNSAVVGSSDVEGNPRVAAGTVDLGGFEALGSCGNAACDGGEDSCNCPADCGAAPMQETACADAIDNDCDTQTDCLDSDCELPCGLVTVPAISIWGVVALSALLLIGGTIALSRRQADDSTTGG